MAIVAQIGAPRPIPQVLPGGRGRWRRALLVAEDLAGVEAGGAARGEEGGGAADGGEKRCGGREGERVSGPDTEEDGLHSAGAGQRGGETDREAERDEQKRIAEDHP